MTTTAWCTHCADPTEHTRNDRQPDTLECTTCHTTRTRVSVGNETQTGGTR